MSLRYLPKGTKLIVCFFCLSSVLSFPSTISATTLVGIWTKNQITIAADSKQTISGLAGITGSQDVCKVYESNNLVFAFAGLAKAEQIDVVETVRKAHMLTEEGTGKKLPLDTLIVAAQSALIQILKARGKSSDQNVSVGLIIAGKIDDKLQMIRQEINGMGMAGDFSFPERSRRIAYPLSAGYDGTDPNRGIEVMGVDNAIKLFKSNSPNWSNGKDEFVAKHLITLETEDAKDSLFVGPPISEIVIKRNGSRWISRGKCQ